MRNLIISSILLLGLTACGGGGGSSNTKSEPEILPKDIVVSDNFDFSTSRKIAIDLNLAEAKDKEAHLSVCTEYTKNGNEYDINYESCVIRTVLDSGVINTSLEVTNDAASVIAVVWFSDPAMLPVYQEFN